MDKTTPAAYVTVGRIGRVYGVHGSVTIHSFTEPRDQILKYQPWLIGDESNWKQLAVTKTEQQSKHCLVQFEGYQSPEQSRALTGLWLAVPRERLPEPAPGEYYWTDLVGLTVKTVSGELLGTVSEVFSTGAHPILVIQGERERMLPFVQGEIITNVDLSKQELTANWDPLF